MSINRRGRRLCRTLSVALILSFAAGCGHREQPVQQTQSIKPGVASYPPGMRLGSDGKPVGRPQ